MTKRVLEFAIGTLILGWLTIALSGCAYCQAVANKNTAACKAERVITQCGPGAVGIFAQAMALVLAGDYTAAIELVVAQATGGEAECIKDAIDTTIADAVRHGAEPNMLRNYRVARHSYGLEHPVKK